MTEPEGALTGAVVHCSLAAPSCSEIQGHQCKIISVCIAICNISYFTRCFCNIVWWWTETILQYFTLTWWWWLYEATWLPAWIQYSQHASSIPIMHPAFPAFIQYSQQALCLNLAPVRSFGGYSRIPPSVHLYQRIFCWPDMSSNLSFLQILCF